MSGVAVTALALALVGQGSLAVTARVDPGIHYLGEAITVRVAVVGADGPVTIEPPRVADADIGPVSADGFVAVPRRSGPLVLPPVRVRSGQAAGAAAPLRLAVAAVPAEGRPPSFLGGVGPFAVAAAVEPDSTRAGGTVEYRLRVAGPAAWGSLRPPDLSGWAAKVPGLRVEPLPPSAVEGDPPARTFRYRLRPTRAGRPTLPPVPVSAFDPASRRYQTRVAPGTPLEVIPLARLDPATLGESKTPTRVESSRPGLAPLAIAAGLVLGLFVAAGWAARRRGRRADDPRRLARALAGRLDPAWDAGLAAERITVALAEYLGRVADRPPGALTPSEAHVALSALVAAPGLADRARRLIEDCDRVRFGPDGPGGRGLVVEAKALFGELAKGGGGSRQPPPSVNGQQPSTDDSREATDGPSPRRPGRHADRPESNQPRE